MVKLSPITYQYQSHQSILYDLRSLLYNAIFAINSVQLYYDVGRVELIRKEQMPYYLVLI